MKNPSYWGQDVPTWKMGNDKKIVGDQIIISCLLGKELEFESVNVTLGSTTLLFLSVHLLVYMRF